jgi:drug/metabolite transporter (DMT)-like permease
MNSFLMAVPLGARYMLFSVLGFALMGACVKIVHLEGIPILEIIAARAIVSVFLSYADIKRKRIPVWGQRRGLLFARGLAGTFALICVYYALVHIPFAEATMLQYLNPMFTAILAILFLGERVQRSTLACIALSFTGLLIIVRPEFLFGQINSGYSLFAVVAAILGAFGSGVAYVLVRKLSASEDPSVIIIYFPLVALPLSIILLGSDFVMPEGITWVWLLLVGVFTQVGQFGLTKAMQTETASQATSFAYTQVVFAAILGWLVFSELPSIWTFVGGGLIILGAFVNIVYRDKIK